MGSSCRSLRTLIATSVQEPETDLRTEMWLARMLYSTPDFDHRGLEVFVDTPPIFGSRVMWSGWIKRLPRGDDDGCRTLDGRAGPAVGWDRRGRWREIRVEDP